MKHTHRGSCQACGRLQAIELRNGRIAKHGYTVDWGFFNGICCGSAHQPLEQDATLTNSIIKQLREIEAPKCDRRAAELEAGTIEPKFFKRGPYIQPHYENGRWIRGGQQDIECKREEITEHDAKRQIAAAICRAQSDARHARSHAAMLETMIVERHGKPLVAVDTKRTLQVGDFVNRGTAKKPMIREVVEIRYQVARGCGPYLNGQHIQHAILKRPEDGATFAVPTRSIRIASIVEKPAATPAAGAENNS